MQVILPIRYGNCISLKAVTMCFRGQILLISPNVRSVLASYASVMHQKLPQSRKVYRFPHKGNNFHRV